MIGAYIRLQDTSGFILPKEDIITFLRKRVWRDRDIRWNKDLITKMVYIDWLIAGYDTQELIPLLSEYMVNDVEDWLSELASSFDLERIKWHNICYTPSVYIDYHTDTKRLAGLRLRIQMAANKKGFG